MNLYEALGVAKTATPDAIKAAYRKKAKKAHPDHGGKREDFERLSKARSILLHPDKRARYDETGIIDETVSPDNEMAQAMNIVTNAVMNVLKNMASRGVDPATQKVLFNAKAGIAGEIEKAKKNAADLRLGVEMLARLSKRFSAKKGKENKIGPMLDAQARQQGEQAAAVEKQIRIWEMAVEIIDNHNFATELPTMIPGGIFQVQSF